MSHPSTTYTIGFSPCPNDCFIFDAMIHGRVDTEGLSFVPVMEDVEQLNQRAMRAELDITKLSYHALAHLLDRYALLNAGSALGRGCGPLLIAKKEYSKEEVSSLRIAIPGKLTTANFLFSLAFPAAVNKTEMLFSDIEGAVLSGMVDAGLIIHENRFTYAEKGLKKIIDLGEFWESTTRSPIPLGGIVVKRTIDQEVQKTIDRVLRRSVEYAFAHPHDSMLFVKEHAQEMKESVMKQHIELYVNDFSIDLGVEGRQAVNTLLNKAKELALIGHLPTNVFV